jgi:hypothetical protein
MPERIDWQARAVAAEVALEVARRERNSAIARAAGLRQALELLLWSCVPNGGELTVPSRCVVHEVTAALDPRGPSIGEIKAEALERLAESHGPHFLSWREVQVIVRAEAARLRGGGQ